MRKFWKGIAMGGLILTLVPSLLVFAGRLSWGTHAQLMVVGMVLWFIGRPLALRRPVAHNEEKTK